MKETQNLIQEVLKNFQTLTKKNNFVYLFENLKLSLKFPYLFYYFLKIEF
jgi:hypothetical protein